MDVSANNEFPRLTWICFGWLLLCINSPVQADRVATTVTFDTSYLVACHTVSTKSENESNSTVGSVDNDAKLVEAHFEISPLVHGRLEDVHELLYRIESTRPDIQVADYLPRTQLESDYAGNINVDLGNESSQSSGIGIAGNYQPTVSGASRPLVSGDMSASRGNKDTANYRYELLPPLEMLAASGTLQRGTGAYFKLKSSPPATLEGSRQFVLVLRVPPTWRADYLRVSCEALADHRNGLSMTGRARFLVALYLQDDAEARRAAADFVHAERQLKGLAATKRREIKGHSEIPFPRIVRVFSGDRHEIPNNWLDQIMSPAPDTSPARFLEQLPSEVVTAAHAYRQAKSELLQMRR